jgi:hypothetical protein
MTQPSPRQAPGRPHDAPQPLEGGQEATCATERLLGVAMAAQSSKPSCPTDIRAGVWGASTSSPAEPRCTHVADDGWRCFGIPGRGQEKCPRHRESRALPAELVVLRDPRTGAPMEVG